MGTINCKICSAQIEKLTTLKNSKVFYHCDDCGFVSLDPKFFLSFAEEKARYDLHQNFSDNSGYTNLLKEFIELAIKPYPAKKILDFGSGPQPVLAQLLRDEGYEVDIYDPYYAKKCQDLEYDLITSTETFEHFRDPLKEFDSITKLLKLDGYLAVMTSFACSYENFKAWRYKDDATHIAFYSLQTFKKITELFDLEIIYSNEKNIIVMKKVM